MTQTPSPDREPPLDERTKAAFLEALAEAVPVLHAWAHLRIRGGLRRWLDPEDVAQEVAVRACQRQASFHADRGSFRAWLLGIGRRVWLEALRELSRNPISARRRFGSGSALEGLAGTITPITRRVVRDEEHIALVERLDRLDEDDRLLLSLVGLEGLSHEAASAILGTTPDACRKRWQRLRERLQHDAKLMSMCVD